MDDALRLDILQEDVVSGQEYVLILILMDDALRLGTSRRKYNLKKVLILILMDDALRRAYIYPEDINGYVLILILMDDALRQTENVKIVETNNCLNPYFNG